jgi:hypothetical protein
MEANKSFWELRGETKLLTTNSIDGPGKQNIHFPVFTNFIFCLLFYKSESMIFISSLTVRSITR